METGPPFPRRAPDIRHCHGTGELGNGVHSGMGSTQDRYKTIDVTRSGIPYKIITNGLGGNWQIHTISWNGTTFSVDAFEGANDGGGPAEYPSANRGTYSNTGNAPCGLPAPINSLNSVDVGWSWSGGAGEYNAAFDILVGDGSNSEGFYMVWLRDPPNFQPAGELVQTGVTVNGLPVTWNIWHTMNGPFGRGITN